MTLVLTDAQSLLAQLVSGSIDPNLIETGQWSGIVSAARQHYLAPILFYKVSSRDGQINVVEQLRQSAREAIVSYIAQDEARWQVNDALRAAEIPNVWIKGSVLAHTIYEQPELRPMADLDVLVPPERFEQARGILENMGYQHSTDATITLPPEFAAKKQRHILLKGGAGNQVSLELHWYLLTPMILSVEQLDWFWGQTHEIEIKGHTITTLKTEAHLLYLCAHAMLQHGAAHTRLIHYCDLHFLISRSDVDWSLVVDRSVTLKWSYAVESALKTTMQYFGTSIPSDVLQYLQDRRPAEEKVWQIDQLAKEGHVFNQVMQLWGKEPLPKKIRFMWSILCPPPAYMVERYSIPPHSPLILWYLRRWAHQFIEVFKALKSRF